MAPRVLVIGLDGFELTLADELGFARFTGAGIVPGRHADALVVGEPVFGEPVFGEPVFGEAAASS